MAQSEYDCILSVPPFESSFKRGGDGMLKAAGERCNASDAVGRLQSPRALKPRWQLWVARRL
jgi:hypothetical protein